MFERNFDMSTVEKPLHIDIPVKLAEVKVAFSVPALAFEGDLPASIFHLQLIENDIADWNAKAQVIAVFHTNAGHVTLNDKAYNTERNVATGNPYKDLVSDLVKRGVHFELCGATAKVHNWGNDDVLPRNQDQHGCHGEDDAARSGGVCENLGMNPRRRPPACRKLPHLGEQYSVGG
jgi:intracellular sulfur oxidation DsrE/DsrF family protein